MEELRMLMGGAATIVTQLVKPVPGNVMCDGAKILKSLICPFIDMSMRANYEGANDGLWSDTYNNLTQFFSLDGFFSKFSTLSHETVRIVARSCEVTPDIEVTSGLSKDFLNEAIQISTNRSFLLIETCKDGEGTITETWLINGKVDLTLPVNCTLYSDYIKCCHINVVGNDEEDIEISPTRMEFTKTEESLTEKIKVGNEEWFRADYKGAVVTTNPSIVIPWLYWVGYIGGPVAVVAAIA